MGGSQQSARIGARHRKGTTMTYRFILDGQGDTPALETEHAPSAQDWNGFAVPIATGDEVRRYVAAAVANDRHHVWTGEVLEDEVGIIVRRPEYDGEPDDDRWVALPNYGTDGPALYALDGFVWRDVTEAVDDLVRRIRASYAATDGRVGFLSDPGGWLAYLDLTDSDDVASAAIRVIRSDDIATDRAALEAEGVPTRFMSDHNVTEILARLRKGDAR